MIRASCTRTRGKLRKIGRTGEVTRMMSHEVAFRFEPPLDDDAAREVGRQVRYFAEEIVDFTFTRDGTQNVAIVLSLRGALDMQALARQLDSTAAAARGRRAVPSRRIWEADGEGASANELL